MVIKKDNKRGTGPHKKKIKGTSKKAAAGEINKMYPKSRPLSRITFRVPKEAVAGARNVSIVGDFNKWSVTQSQMKKMKNGDFTLTLELPCNREYNFRYVIDADQWEKDWFADGNVPEE